MQLASCIFVSAFEIKSVHNVLVRDRLVHRKLNFNKPFTCFFPCKINCLIMSQYEQFKI